ncbi:glutathione S-transferase family protein [Hyphobacterium marinum]|uniref:Glutathione S-transferase family protein n=1 Tax=Hyphobacterium marinum TaxID=3116574 RepID=A0ABU7LX56_9PROT|nr:glutathione S-transferase family protein [Hyphobacterium sp. Y6023]MEE2566144.1 glutathione S-transferase family protein [Hyphobacterium sp. Y6023]
MSLTLHIGNKRLSSWSMRPWLALKKAGIAFTENVIPLDQDDTRETLLALSPAATVPVLQKDDLTIWDSLAICEWAAEQVPSLWPADPVQRARARAVTASMHSGFGALRSTLSMDLQRPVGQTSVDVACWADIERMEALWAAAKTGNGLYLFGDWSIADAFFTPVATRFQTYDIPLSSASRAYVDALLADPVYQDWRAAALEESFNAPFH